MLDRLGLFGVAFVLQDATDIRQLNELQMPVE